MKENGFKIRFENVNLSSNSGPNSFANKLYKELTKNGHSINTNLEYDMALCFIEDLSNLPSKNLFQRLDGIYFNTAGDYQLQNSNILRTYNRAKGVIFQSAFNKRLTEIYFGEHKNNIIIHNGADVEFIKTVKPTQNAVLDRYKNVWCCAASWRPHKRLKDNIRYFLEHQEKNDCLVIAGNPDYHVNEPNVFYVGNLDTEPLFSLYKRSKYFIHLAWLDHCPNVVVDARASGCKIICSSAGGTKEIAGLEATIVEEAQSDYKPTKLYSPPRLDFSTKVKNNFDTCYNIKNVAERYLEFITK